jgi:hypothetical protein
MSFHQQGGTMVAPIDGMRTLMEQRGSKRPYGKFGQGRRRRRNAVGRLQHSFPSPD